MIIIGVEVKTRAKWLGKDAKKAIRESIRDGMYAVAWHWHEKILDKHFASSNRSRYQHEPRTDVYTKFIKRFAGQGQGRFIDQLLSGKSRRYLKAFASVSGTAKSVTLIMKPGRYFTNPFVGTFTHPKTGQTKKITRQPDKVAEITRVDAADGRELREFGAAKIAELLRGTEYTHNIRVDA